MDSKEQAIAAVELLTPLVRNTAAAQLTNATPCDKWAVADLINHLVGGGYMFAFSLRGEPIEGDPSANLLGDDHVAAFVAAVEEFRQAAAEQRDLSTPTVLPFATLPADVALRLAAGDLLVHSWDLAQATGQAFDPPSDFVAEALDFFEMAIGPEMRDGMFGPALAIEATATPMDRLLAFAGRHPK
jgi:uncharacterized protein (TIGR03086 family)